MMKKFVFSAVLLCATLFAHTAWSHESRPVYFEITEQSEYFYELLWKVPLRNGKSLEISPQFAIDCVEAIPASEAIHNSALITRSLYQCKQSLADTTIHFQGLEKTLTDILVKIHFLNGIEQTAIVKGKSPQLHILSSPSKYEVLRDYTILGVEHILLGFDHLLFVLCLLLIVQNTALLIKTITAFTLSHSITLGLAALGFVNIPSPPVEAIIALSIVFLARELIKQQNGTPGLTSSYPWLVALVFGLLHGLGFAGALSDIGLPQNEIPLALLTFNIGVELGQLIFIFFILLLIKIKDSVYKQSIPHMIRITPAYSIGVIASFWLIERIAGF